MDITFRKGAAVKDKESLLCFNIKSRSSRKLTRFSSLYSCIDQTLSPSHGMEEELCRCQASQIGVLHKASALRAIVVFNEMWERAVFEAKGDSFTLHVLLAHHSNNLKSLRKANVLI